MESKERGQIEVVSGGEGREGPGSEFDSGTEHLFILPFRYQMFLKVPFIQSSNKYNAIDCFPVLLNTHTDLCRKYYYVTGRETKSQRG